MTSGCGDHPDAAAGEADRLLADLRRAQYGKEREVLLPESVKDWLAAYVAGAAGDPALADPRWRTENRQPDGDDGARTAVGWNNFNSSTWKPAL